MDAPIGREGAVRDARVTLDAHRPRGGAREVAHVVPAPGAGAHLRAVVVAPRSTHGAPLDGGEARRGTALRHDACDGCDEDHGGEPQRGADEDVRGAMTG
jgi:hypothetical protein